MKRILSFKRVEMTFSKIKFLPVVALIFILSACAAAVIGLGVGAGYVIYKNGELKSIEGATMKEAWNAVTYAVETLGYIEINKEKGTEESRMLYRTEADEKIDIRIRYRDRDLTDIIIRVGFLGNEEISRNILDLVHQQLY